MDVVIPQKGKRIPLINLIEKILIAISCYIMIIPLSFLDLLTWQFQAIYFSIKNIPKINREEYFSMDRYLLHKLNFMQKINCVYCEYANGVVAYSKAVANQMEIYSCAIKHIRTPKGHEHHQRFYDRKKFE